MVPLLLPMCVLSPCFFSSCFNHFFLLFLFFPFPLLFVFFPCCLLDPPFFSSFCFDFSQFLPTYLSLVRLFCLFLATLIFIFFYLPLNALEETLQLHSETPIWINYSIHAIYFILISQALMWMSYVLNDLLISTPKYSQRTKLSHHRYNGATQTSQEVWMIILIFISTYWSFIKLLY